MSITTERSQHGVQPMAPPPLYQQHVIRQQQQQQQQPSQMPLFPQPHQILGPSGALPQLPQFASLPQPAGFVGGLPSSLPPQPHAMTGAMPVPLSQSNPVQMLYSVQVGPNGVPVLLPLGPQFGAPGVLPQPAVLSQPLPQPQGQQLPQHFQAPPQLQVMQQPPMYTQAFAGIPPAPTSSEHAGLRQVHSQYVRKPDSLRGPAAPPQPQHVATGPATGPATGGSREVTVIDPTLHVGKVAIPYHLTLPTRGRAEWDRGTSRRDLSLCCLFQRGRCHAGDGCHQIHADREFVATMRERQAASVSCCVGCGDTLPARNPFCRAFFNGVNAVHVIDAAAPGGPRTWTLSPKQLAYTVGLQDQFTHDGCGIEAGTATVSLGSVCRLQRRGACKYGKDCKRVHVCSKVVLDTDGSLAGTGEDQFGVSAPAAAAAAVWEAEHEGNSQTDTHADHSQGTYALDDASVDCYSPSLPVEKRIHRVEAAGPAGH